MRFDGYKLLKIIVRARELPFREVFQKLPKKFNDHRDFLSLASLCHEGFVDTTLPKQPDVLLYAEMFQAYHQGSMYARVQPMNPNTQNGRFYALAKGDLYFHEQHEKWMERLYGLFIAILVGVLSGILLNYLIGGLVK